MGVSDYILWIVVILQLLVIFMITKVVVNFLNNFPVKRELNSKTLMLGDKAPLFREYDQNENIITLTNQKHKTTMLLFVDSKCDKCHSVINMLLSQYKANLIIIFNEKNDYYSTKLNELNIPNHIPVINSPILFSNYFVKVIPTAVLIDSNGYIISINEIDNVDIFKVTIKALSIQTG